MSNQHLRNILSAFETISLEEMDSVRLMNRVDTKFVFSYNQLLDILPTLTEEYRILSIDNNLTPSYESVYYDDDNFFFYSEHHRRRKDRFKVRYRKYVESNLSFLEVKHKNKGRTDKNRIIVDDLTKEMPEDHRKFVQSTGVPDINLKPVMTNTFNRITMVAKHSIERLTLDVNLTFEGNGKEKLMSDLVIAELKQQTASRKSPFYQALKKRQIRPYRISKYCIGMIKLMGEENIKYNRFKKKLLKLKKIRTNAA